MPDDNFQGTVVAKYVNDDGQIFAVFVQTPDGYSGALVNHHKLGEDILHDLGTTTGLTAETQQAAVELLQEYTTGTLQALSEWGTEQILKIMVTEAMMRGNMQN